MGDFHAYYSGALVAPYLTIFIGGNHEASNYLSELFYGGWVAPNIYYLGAANVIRCGSLRIAGLSGIWKGYDYRKPHHERMPYNQDDVKSIYHVREVDVRKLMQIKTQVDVGLSHDWPNGVEWMGDWKSLFRFKRHFEDEARAGQLGSMAAKYVMDRLRPRYWFAAHMHARFAAVAKYDQPNVSGIQEPPNMLKVPQVAKAGQNDAEIEIDLDDDPTGQADKGKPASVQNSGEIDLDVENSELASDDARALLPESFSRPQNGQKTIKASPPPAAISNTTTQFLALDKCLPKRHFLQLLEIASSTGEEHQDAHTGLAYDKEWLAITRVFAPDFTFGELNARIPPDKGETHFAPMIAAQEKWIEENLVEKGSMSVPQNFEMTAPSYDITRGINSRQQPKEYTNPQTAAYCRMLGIPIPFDASDEDREQRRLQGPLGGSRGFGHGRGKGRGRGRGYR